MQDVLKWLAEDSRQWTRQILQDLVDILSAIMMKQIRLCGKDMQALSAFREKYAEMVRFKKMYISIYNSVF